MKNKKKIIIFILILLALISTIGVYFYINKQNETKLDKKTKEYLCEKKTDWESFDFRSIDDEDLGKYKSIYSISFKIKDDIEMTNFLTQEKYEFTNVLGFDSLERESKNDFDEEIDEKKLMKTYSSKTFIPVNFENYVNNDEPLNDYIKDIEILGYICKEI